jgi:hypothetical protein
MPLQLIGSFLFISNSVLPVVCRACGFQCVCIQQVQRGSACSAGDYVFCMSSPTPAMPLCIIWQQSCYSVLPGLLKFTGIFISWVHAQQQQKP